MTPKELSAAVPTMVFVDVAEAVRPLLERHARSYIHGFDFEDLRQELLMVVWQTQRVYDPLRGSFLNVLIHGFRNRLEWLRRQSRRQTQPVVALICRECKVVRQVTWRPTCVCGSRSFEEDRTPSALIPIMAYDDGASSVDEGPLAQVLAREDYNLALVDEWNSLTPAAKVTALARWDP